MNKFVEALVVKFGKGNPLTPHTISWDIAPKINAVFRNGDSENRKLLFAGFAGEADEDDVVKMAGRCYRQQNEIVRSVVADMSANLLVGKNYVVGFIGNEHKEYSGLLAGRLSGQCGKPAFVLREADSTAWSGSMRSKSAIADIINSSGLAKCMGHDKAAGILIRKSNFDRFLAWFDEQDIESTDDEVEVAAELRPEDITLDLCKQIGGWNYLFGNDLPAPLFYVEFEIPAATMPICGKNNDVLRYPPFIKFGCSADEVVSLSANCANKIKAVVELGVNEYGDVQYPQAKIAQMEIEPMAGKEKELNWEEIFS